MKIYSVFLILFFICQITVAAQNDSALNEVVAAEKAFAAMAAEKGTNLAFVEYAAPEGLVFNQKPVNARYFYGKRPSNSSLLAWSPNFAGISSTGELGFTTGNWSFHPKGKTDAPTAFGEFATIWKRQPDGKYRFAVDLGIQHAKYETEIPQQTSFFTRKADKKSDSQNWQKLENDFADSLKKNGLVKTYDKLLAETSRLLRENHFPFVGRKEALRAVSIEKYSFTAKPINGELSGDFAYVYGEYELTDSTNKTERGFYLRVWKQTAKGWQIALDVLHPTPPAKN
jgi:ketosteroid isomerase-like protein